MKIDVLMENTAIHSPLTAEHGLSLLIETNRHKILFDTGQTGAFADNARYMGVDLQQVDLAVLSHGHYDHGGGLARFLELNDHAPVYLSHDAFMPHFHGVQKYIGLDKSLSGSDRLVFTADELKIDGELSLYSCNQKEKSVPADSAGLQMTAQGALLPDDFRHEQYLLVHDQKRRILVSGCSHKGILNIANWFRPDVLVGGFHFMHLDPDDPSDRKRLEDAAQRLLENPTKYYTGHCTGTRPYRFLKEIMGDRLESFAAGQSIYL
jgi:7,8-dihydropterin-6-yl-methyl-4-(beta-D-ribofuranosyl)aminobenzene 5'-phosphate synthase